MIYFEDEVRYKLPYFGYLSRGFNVRLPKSSFRERARARARFFLDISLSGDKFGLGLGLGLVHDFRTG